MGSSPPTGPRKCAFDRVVSVEMFEHMWNYDQLLARIASWLRPGGKLFVHIFCHGRLVYPFESEGDANWMGRYFFSGGIMPSAALLGRFDRKLSVTRTWSWDGRYYQRTAEAWLANLDKHRELARSILGAVYGEAEARRWLQSLASVFSGGRGIIWICRRPGMVRVAVPVGARKINRAKRRTSEHVASPADRGRSRWRRSSG